MLKRIHVWILLVIVFIWTTLICGHMQASVQEKLKVPGQMTELKLPDLLVDKIEIETEPAENDRIKLTLRYTIFNDSSVSTKDFPTEEGKKAWEKNAAMNWLFKCTVEARVYPMGNYREDPNGSVATLCKPHEKQTFHTVRTITPGMVLQFRVKVDAENWIREKNENNNEKTYIYKTMAIKKK